MALILYKGSAVTLISSPRQSSPEGVGVNKNKNEKSHSGSRLCAQAVHLSALVECFSYSN